MRTTFLLFSSLLSAFCCQLKDFMPCVMQLNNQKVAFNINPLEVISNITTEAKLIHTCRTYAKVFSCFDEKIRQCGTTSQKMQLDRGKRLHSYLCAPFSLQRQKIFLKRNDCIQQVVKNANNENCDLNSTLFGEKLKSCRDNCKQGPCLKKIELTELSICTYTKISEKCSSEAAEFYSQMQRVISNKDYPMQCVGNSNSKTHELKKGLPVESVIPETTTSTNTFPLYDDQVIDGVVTRTHNPIVRRTDPNSKFKPRQTTIQSKMPIIKTLLVDERGSPLPTVSTRSTGSPKIVHKFLPNPYTTPTPSIQKTDPIRTTRTIFGNQIKYTQWAVKPNNKNLSAPVLPPIPMGSPAPPSPPINFKFKLPPAQTSTQPFKVEINWMDDGDTETTPSGKYMSPWYLKSTPTLRLPEQQIATTDKSFSLETVNPLLNQLRSQSLNLTEIGNQANTYFSAALNAFTETKKEMTQNDPWRALIDAVAPTIQKVSPDIIPRIRDEINRIQPQQN